MQPPPVAHRVLDESAAATVSNSHRCNHVTPQPETTLRRLIERHDKEFRVTQAAVSKAESRPGLGEAAASLTERRLALVRQREAQAARLAGLRNTTRGVPHIASDGQVLTAQLAGTRQLLAEVGAALQRIDDGTYGFCGDCGAVIAADLLQAVPLARLCMSCQHNENR